jgi:PKHD-type hydroxylase
MNIPAHNPSASTACHYSGGFTEDELEELDKYLNSLMTFKAEVGDIKGPAPVKTRVSDVAFFKPEELPWFSVRMHGIIDKINKDWFKVNIDHIGEGYQYTEYHATEGGHYNWHVDSHNTFTETTRKLSMILALNDYKDYKGGEFKERLGGGTKTWKLNRGDILVIPSYALHKVTRVSKGTRKSIICWVSGPQYI